MKKCKITVVKTLYNKDLVDKYSNYGKDHTTCPVFKEGQSFISGMEMPEGFCAWAWDDIHKMVFAVLADADFEVLVPGSMKNRKACIACCTDAYRPVVFYLEPVE